MTIDTPVDGRSTNPPLLHVRFNQHTIPDSLRNPLDAAHWMALLFYMAFLNHAQFQPTIKYNSNSNFNNWNRLLHPNDLTNTLRKCISN